MKKETIPELLSLALENKDKVTNLPFEVGKKYFIRTVTYHSTGLVKAIVGNFLILEKGAWIANSGRLSDALQKGIDKVESSEIEPYHVEWMVNIQSIIDACEYPFDLPKEQK